MDEGVLVGSPAGRPADAAGQQPEGVLLLNARDERSLAWVIEQVGLEAVRNAIPNLAGNRKPFVTNLAKALGLTIPQQIINTPSETVLERIQELRRAGLLTSGRQ